MKKLSEKKQAETWKSAFTFALSAFAKLEKHPEMFDVNAFVDAAAIANGRKRQ